MMFREFSERLHPGCWLCRSRGFCLLAQYRSEG